MQPFLNFLKKYRYDISVGAAIVIITIWTYLSRDAFGFLSSREQLQNFVASFGGAAPLIVILLIIAEVIIAPIPGSIPAITAGFVFGPVMGSLYTYIGNVAGSLIVFFLVRRFGRPIALKLFHAERLKKYEKAVARRENLLLVFYFFPLLPLDIITAVFGLSAVKSRKFAAVIAVGYVFYSVILTLFGDYLAVVFFG